MNNADYLRSKGLHTLADLRARGQHKGIVRWLMGETPQTNVELVLGGILFGLVIFKFFLELTA